MANLELRRFDVTAFKSISPTNVTQIPAESVICTVYRQGATVKTDTSILTGVTGSTVNVYSVGRLAVGDILQVETDSTLIAIVLSVDSATSATLRSISGAAISVVAGNRLVITNTQPVLYQDSAAQLSYGVSEITLDAMGYGYFYTPAARFDYIISGTGITSALYPDAIGGWVRGGVAWINVLDDFATFQDAIDALPTSGGTIYVPSGTYTRNTTPAVVPMTFTKPVRLLGDGGSASGNTTGTRVIYRNYATEDTTSNLLTVTAHTGDWLKIEDIYFEGAGTSGTGKGLVLKKVYDVLVRDCTFNQFPSYALESAAGASSPTDDVVNCLFEHVIFENSKSNALVGFGNYTFFLKFNDCNFITSTGRGAYLSGACQGTVFNNCTFQTSQTDGANQEFIYASFSNGMNKLIISGCWFENGATTATPTSWMIQLVGPMSQPTIRDCYFARPTFAGGSRSMRLIKTSNSGSGVYGLSISDCMLDAGGDSSVGTDDILITSQDSGVVLRNLTVRDTSSYGANSWRISGETSTNHYKLGFSNRLKVPAIDQTAIGNLNDANSGDIIYNSDNACMNIQTAAGWRAVGAYRTSSGKPTTGTWVTGDVVINTADQIIYICTAGGSPGTWYKTGALTLA